jgi:hypothetical protein
VGIREYFIIITTAGHSLYSYLSTRAHCAMEASMSSADGACGLPFARGAHLLLLLLLIIIIIFIFIFILLILLSRGGGGRQPVAAAPP